MTFRRAASAASMAALLVLTGCGSDSDSDSDETSDETSSDEPSSAPTSEPVEPAEPVEPPAGAPGDALTLASFATTTSAAQVAAQSAHVEVKVETRGQNIEISGDMGLAETLEDTSFAVEMSPDLGSGVSLILVDNTLYLRTGHATDDKYLKLSLDEGNPLGAFYAQLLGQSDPAGIVRAFDGAIEDFEKRGTEKIDGTMTTRYRDKVDTRKVLSTMLGSQAAQARAEMGLLPKRLTYDVWVGNDDRLPRRMEYDVMGSAVTMELTNWGEPVDIQPPPDEEITEDPIATIPTEPMS